MRCDSQMKKHIVRIIAPMMPKVNPIAVEYRVVPMCADSSSGFAGAEAPMSSKAPIIPITVPATPIKGPSSVSAPPIIKGFLRDIFILPNVPGQTYRARDFKS